MPKAAQIRGMLLEEVLLFLLKISGYRTIETIEPNDSTLGLSAAGLEVKGRGANHQIDAIADFEITPPFTYPLRLLVEAKCYKNNGTVGIEIVRNALGVLKTYKNIGYRPKIMFLRNPDFTINMQYFQIHDFLMMPRDMPSLKTFFDSPS